MSNTIGDLLNTPPEDLIEERNRVRHQIEALEREADLIDRVIEVVMEAGGPAAEWFADPARPFIAVGSLRSQIGRLVNSPEPQPWAPAEVHDQLQVSGNTKATLDNVRVTMRRMAANGELIQPQKGLLMFLPMKGAEEILAQFQAAAAADELQTQGHANGEDPDGN